MKINVPEFARGHFWEEPPPDTIEFWAFRFPPPCKEGDPLLFCFDKKVVATAVVDRIERPGRSVCEATGKYGRGWKVFWTNESFRDLRGGG